MKGESSVVKARHYILMSCSTFMTIVIANIQGYYAAYGVQILHYARLELSLFCAKFNKRNQQYSRISDLLPTFSLEQNIAKRRPRNIRFRRIEARNRQRTSTNVHKASPQWAAFIGWVAFTSPTELKRAGWADGWRITTPSVHYSCFARLNLSVTYYYHVPISRHLHTD